jgi:two-component system chemotaxis sensor kinase CheA
VIRNALDHGVESAEARAAAGKPPSATILLRASRVGDRVQVEVRDDGRGVDLTRVREAALARGLVTADALAGMSDEAVMDLIFTPGFSTASEVTSLSGRGVGMDAVRSAVERLGGGVAIESAPGVGTTVRLVMPFTVLMSQVMTVEAGGQMFGIPLEAVVETVRLPRDRISAVGAAQAFVLRERTIPLISLGETLGEGRASDEGDTHVVVAMAAGGLAGLQVDRLGERMEVMLKPMEGLLAGAPGIAGATLLGDGRVLIILDLEALLE